MRRLLLLGFLVFLASALFAQITPRGGTSTLSPRSSASPSREEAPAPTRTKDTGTPPPPHYYAPPSPPYRPERLNAEPSRIASNPRQNYEPEPRWSENPAPYRPARPQEQPTGSVQWLSLEEALERSKTEKRKIFIDFYTDWCGWCKRMDENTFSDTAVARYIGEKYYPVKFNAESSAEVAFQNKTYGLRRGSDRSYHELAIELLNGRLGFPTLVFLDENLHVIQAIPGYREPDQLFKILNYFGTDSHKTTPWETYEQKFNRQR
ncbi:MAG: DUF255 domain-containing protein [Saprospiraceae bacterium]|nr:DUF255 domain-containing protein [Saprospiraceae bacterium]MDW8230830.1 DUF255 domain-containing protein [Saprospiraceae bacterium]